MPSQNLENVLSTKPVTFNIKTSGGSWKCRIHSNRAAYERTRTTSEATAPTPGISRTDSGLSTTSTSSASSTN
ncbi:hypothetical protein F4801DRAFT_576330 [Xylaria longipes]|nr:hypothetical protein F4801DRAFT_576330 [Xylaria longipes]RYC55550.1 hypothetical protein CHU98_g10656 [Xylaria longipes]